MAAEWIVELRCKAMRDLEEKTIAAVIEWLAHEQDHLAEESNRYVICAGLAVAQALKRTFPLARKDYITPRNQVRTDGPLIRDILGEFGESHVYTAEVGQTTTGTCLAR